MLIKIVLLKLIFQKMLIKIVLMKKRVEIGYLWNKSNDFDFIHSLLDILKFSFKSTINCLLFG